MPGVKLVLAQRLIVCSTILTGLMTYPAASFALEDDPAPRPVEVASSLANRTTAAPPASAASAPCPAVATEREPQHHADANGEAGFQDRGSSGWAVPPPFAPLSIERLPDRIIVRAWGRLYEFRTGPLPSSIVSQDSELLAAPASVRIGEGTIDWDALELVDDAPDRIRLSTRGRSGTARFNAEISIEYDGMIQLDLSIRGPAKLSSLSYEIPLRNEQSSLFSHHLVYDYEAGITNRNDVLKTAGRTPNGERRFRFVPSFSLGGRAVGIEWWSETNGHWFGPRVRDPYKLERTDRLTTLTIEPVSAPMEIEEDQTWRDQAAIFALPIRPPPENWRSVRFVASGPNAPEFSTKIGTRMAWVAFGSSFHPFWHGLPASHKHLPEHKDLRRRLKKREIAYIPYAELVATPTLHPTARERFSEWSADGVWWTGPLPTDVASVLEFNGISWKPRQPHTYAPCMGVQSYVDWILSQNVETLDAEGPDGLYFDHATIARMCRLNPRLEGKRDREIWEYLSIRSFFKRLYVEMKRRNPDALLVIHSPGHPRALAGLADFIWTGEQLATVFRGGATLAQLISDPSLHRPDYLALPSGYMDAALGPHPGGAWVLIPQISRSFLEKTNPGQGRRYHRAMHGWALANDVPLILGNTDKEEAEKIYRALDRFGSLAGATVHPWWSRRQTLPETRTSLLSTTYLVDGRGLVVLLNAGSDPVSTRIPLDSLPPAIRDATKALDLENPEQDISIDDASFLTRVPARDFKIIAVE